MSNQNILLVIQYVDSSSLSTVKFRLDREIDKNELLNRYGVTQENIDISIKNGTHQFKGKDRYDDVQYTLIKGWDGK